MVICVTGTAAAITKDVHLICRDTRHKDLRFIDRN